MSVVLQAVSKFSENELVLRPHVKKLVMCCLRFSLRARQPHHFFLVLRFLFRVLSASKLDQCMHELPPLLGQILSSLYKLYERIEDEYLRDLVVELSLTVPARLSRILPHLPLMMRLIVHALRSKNDLANLGLRTLDFWAENINQDQLYLVLSQQPTVLTELMTALSLHLRPMPYTYGPLAAKLLGKLGGKNRLFIKDPLPPWASRSFNSSFPLHPNASDLHAVFEWDVSSTSSMATLTSSTSSLPSIGSEMDIANGEHIVKLPLDKCISSVCALLNRLVQTNPAATFLSSSSRPAASSGISAAPPSSSSLSGSHSASVTGTGSSTTTTTTSAGKEIWEHERASQEALLQKHKDSAMDFLVSCLAFLIKVDTTNGVAGGDAMDTSSGGNISPLSNAEPSPSQPRMGNLHRFNQILNAHANDFNETIVSNVARDKELLHKQNALLRDLLKTLMVVASDAYLEGQARPLLQGLAAHFLTVVCCCTRRKGGAGQAGDDASGEGESSQPTSTTTGNAGARARVWDFSSSNLDVRQQPSTWELDESAQEETLSPFELNEAIVEAFLDGRAGVHEVGSWVIQMTVTTARDLSFLPPKNKFDDDESRLTAALFFEHLLNALLKSCYRKAGRAKLGAARGLRELCQHMDSEWVQQHEVAIVRDLLFILKDQPADAPLTVVEETTESLLTIVGLSHPQGSTVSPSPKLIRMLAHEIGHGKPSVRAAVRLVFWHLESACGITVQEELSLRCREDMKDKLFEKKMISTQAAQRIGIMDAIFFCLRTNKSPVMVGTMTSRPSLSGEGGDGVPTGGGGGDEPTPMDTENEAAGASQLETPEKGKSGSIGSLTSPSPTNMMDVEPEIGLFNKPLLDLTDDIMTYVVDCHDNTTKDEILDQVKSSNVAYAAATEEKKSSSGSYNVTPRSHLDESVCQRGVFINDMFTITELPHPFQMRFYLIRMVVAAYQNNPRLVASENYRDFRYRFIATCFKAILLPCTPLVDAALQALDLALVVDRNIPKDTLHQCLRPGLKNLQDWRLLSLPILHGLLRMLYALRKLNGRLFNANFPEKLMEHAHNWTKPEAVLTEERWVPGSERVPASVEPEIAAAILHLFHLIQPTDKFYDRFLEPLVVTTVRLEAALPRYKYVYVNSQSPFVVPLTKFLNRYATEGKGNADQVGF